MKQKRICLFLAAVLVLTSLFGCRKPDEKPEETLAATEPPLRLKEGIQTILILCSDDFDTAKDSGGFRNGMIADFVMLMVIDEPAGKITSLQLNPDTLVPFAVPGKSEKVEMPLGEVYSYGSGGSDSCLYVTKVVSQLLEGIKVDNYLTFTMDSVGIVNDMIGGVVLPSSGLGTDENPENREEPLSGAEAVTYFSHRDPEDTDNREHMLRQRQYIAAMYSPFMASAQKENFLTRLSLQLGDRMGTGLTLSQLIQMFESMAALSMEEEILTIPGEVRQVDGRSHFTVDKDALQQTVNRLFVVF